MTSLSMKKMLEAYISLPQMSIKYPDKKQVLPQI